MTFVIRPARAEDIASITSWTTDTFSWGDYVPEQMPAWLEDEQSLVIVCTYEDDVPVAVARAQLLSSTEAWLSGARVHPGHRRSGMGSAMNDFSIEWAKGRGALVARLVIEEANAPARAQVEKIGYRLTSLWLYCTMETPPGSLVSPAHRLQLAGSFDADAAWMFWSQSDLARAGRELIAEGWRWRRARRADLDKAVADRSLYQGQGGYAIVAKRPSGLSVGWLATTDADAPSLLQGLARLPRGAGTGALEVMVPETPWLAEAMKREAFEIRPVLMYAKGL